MRLVSQVVSVIYSFLCCYFFLSYCCTKSGDSYAVAASFVSSASSTFGAHRHNHKQERRQRTACLHAGEVDSGDDSSPDDNNDKTDDTFYQEYKSVVEKVLLEQTREKLEQDNIKSFLKRKPKKLPYEQARKWVPANLGADTREEFNDLVENGNLRHRPYPRNQKNIIRPRENGSLGNIS